MNYMIETHNDGVIKWKYFPRYWPFVRGIHRSPVNSPHKGQWNGALIFSLNCVWINSLANNRETGDLRRHHAHYDVIVMDQYILLYLQKIQKCNHHLTNTASTHFMQLPHGIYMDWTRIWYWASHKNFLHSSFVFLLKFKCNACI